MKRRYYKVTVVQPMKETMNVHNLPNQKFFQIQLSEALLPRPNRRHLLLTGTKRPFTMIVFNSGNTQELFNELEKRTKRWINFPQTCKGLRLVGQVVQFQTPQFYITDNGNIRYCKIKTAKGFKEMPMTMNHVTGFVSEGDDPQKIKHELINRLVKDNLVK